MADSTQEMGSEPHQGRRSSSNQRPPAPQAGGRRFDDPLGFTCPPQCGAGVRVPDGQIRVDCPYCHTTLFVRDGLLHVVHHGARSAAIAVSAAGILVAIAIVALLWSRPVARPVVTPVPPGPVLTITNPEPDYLGSPEAMAGILELGFPCPPTPLLDRAFK